MPRKSLLLALSVCVWCSVLAAARDLIPAGTLLQCTIDEPNFSSKTALVGDPVLCHLGPLGSFGHSIFPRGAMLGGHMVDYKDPGHFVGKGWIQLEFDRMILPGDQVLPLAAKVISAPHMKVDAQGDIHGKGHPKRDVVEWMIPVLWPIKLITLPARGPYPALKGETHIALRLMEDVEVPFPTAKYVPMPPWVNPGRYDSSYYPSSLDSHAQLQPRLASAQTATVSPAAYYSQAAQPATQLPAQPAAQTTVIALNDGSAFLAQDYWVQDGQLYCVSADAKGQNFPLEKIDLGQTVRVNRERNVSFVLRSRGAVEQ